MSRDRGARAFQNARLKKQQQADARGISDRALALHQAGRPSEAEPLYRQVLELVPDHFDALHLLGVCEMQKGRLEEADRLIKQALSIDPRSAPAYANRGIVLFELERYNEAVACYDRALLLKPDYLEALSNRGAALLALERYDEALASLNKALALRPSYALCLNNRGNTLQKLGRLDEAREDYDKAIAIKPDLADAFNNRGTLHNQLREFDEAITDYKRALALKPNYAKAMRNYGDVLSEFGQFDDAMEYYDKAFAANPTFTEALLGRAGILIKTRRISEAKTVIQQALTMDPESLIAMTQLGQCHQRQGNIDEAIACYDRALAITPDFEPAISNKIFALDFATNTGFEEHQAVRRLWWEKVGSAVAASHHCDYDNTRNPGRRIVLGYVSSDFRTHSAAAAFGPILERHDKTQFEVICYSCSSSEDHITKQFEEVSSKWRNASQWSDMRIVEQAHADKVDILIDLSGHSAGNRLGVFARKPAPIQVTAWGHATGTGLPTIDYLFSDPVAIPQSVRHLFAEKIYDLPCLITADPPPDTLQPVDPPVLEKGYITFGMFNRIDKMSDDAVRVWSQLLQAQARSRLLIKGQALDDESVVQLTLDRFAAHGISPDRLDFLGTTSPHEHLAAFKDVDIALDPFPQNGGISTWDALHMGVPVVSVLGNSLASRLSGAILASVGLNDWIAEDLDGYVAIALKYASQPDMLKTLRHTLRNQAVTSAAGDRTAYTRAVEQAYRNMWVEYCERQA